MRRGLGVFAALGVLLVLPVRGAEERPVVIGTGNRISGTVPVAFVGDPAGAAASGLGRILAAIEGRTALSLPLSTAASLADVPPGAVVLVCGRPPEGGGAADLLRRLRERGGAALVLGAPPVAPALRVEIGGRLIASPLVEPTAELVVLALRAAILDPGAVRHLRSAFSRIAGRVEGDLLVLDVAAALPGEVEISLLAVEGGEVLPAGPVRPVDLNNIADPDGTLVRLRFRGEGGLSDEARIWLPDFLPGAHPVVRVEGEARPRVGDPLRFRVTAAGADGLPLADLGLSARLGDLLVTSRTDAAGAAFLAFPAPDRPGESELELRWRGARFEGGLEAGVRVEPRPRAVRVGTDRHLVRPGGEVGLRALVTDAGRRTAIDGEEVTFSVKDPRGRRIAELTAVTGRFGEAIRTLPLASDLPEGEYEVRAAAGDAAGEGRFRVEDVVLPVWRVDLSLAGGEAAPDAPVRGTVRAATFAGEPLAGAEVRIEAAGAVGAGRRLRLDAEGSAGFEIDRPAGAAGPVRILATVEHAGATATATAVERPLRAPRIEIRSEPNPLVAGTPGRIRCRLVDADGSAISAEILVSVDGDPRAGGPFPSIETIREVRPAPDARSAEVTVLAVPPGAAPIESKRTLPVAAGLALEAPETAAPGDELAVTVRSTARTGTVILDLAAGSRLLAGATADLADGRADATLAVPADAAGPLTLLARRPGAPGLSPGRRTVEVVTDRVEVSLRADRETAAPGDGIVLTARVTGPDGRGRPALLDLVGLEAAWAAAEGESVREPSPAPEEARSAVLARSDAARARARFLLRAERASRAAFERAVKELRAGREPTTTLPWGARVVASPAGSRCLLTGEPAATDVPSGAPPRFEPGPVWSEEVPAAGLAVAEILPSGARREPVAGTGDPRMDWFSSRQEADGSFRPASPRVLADLEPWEEPGDPWFEPGTTGLVLLAYLGAGQTHRHGSYRRVVRDGLRYLVSLQDDDGFVGDRTSPLAVLNHAIAALALAEAYGLTASPLFRGAALRAVAALRPRQRGDGSFAEAGWPDGGLVATAWAASAAKSAGMAGLAPDPEILAGIRRFVEARADPVTGRVEPCAEEVRAYPFPATDGPVAAAGMTAMIRILTGEDFRRSPAIAALAETLRANLPVWDRPDLHAFLWGNAACFQIGGETWRSWNEALKSTVVDHQGREGSRRGSWPGGGRMGRVAATAFGTMCMEVYYRYGRVFGDAGGGPRVRSRFPDLAVSDLAWPTDSDGSATRSLTLPDQVTVWDFRVGAWDGRGGYARASLPIRTTLPLRLEAELPSRLFEGDRLRVPVRVRSTLDEAVRAEVVVVAADGFAAETATFTVAVPARGAGFASLPLTALAPGDARLELSVRAGAHADALGLRTVVRSRAAAFTFSLPLIPGEPVRIGAFLPGGARDLSARIVASGGPLGAAAGGLSGLIRRPHGCFEQTAATMYPALLALRYLEQTGLAAPELSAEARDALLVGYQRILGFEVPGGGFSLYGEGAARADLTALGIHLLLDLDGVLPVDAEIVRRAATWLGDHLPDRGPERVYAAAAVKRAGGESAFDPATLFRGRPDPYSVALAVTLGLVPPDRAAAAAAALAASARIGPGTAAWSPAGPTLFAGQGPGSEVEATALAASALRTLGARPDLVAGALRRVVDGREGDGAWSTTRETVAALSALLATAADPGAPATVAVLVDGREVASRPVAPDRTEAIDLGPVTPASVVVARVTGGAAALVTVAVEGVSANPPSGGPLDLAVRWPGDAVPAGSRVAARVTLRAVGGRPVHAPMVEVPIPAGLRPDREALGRAAREAGFPRAEVADGRIHLYGDRLPGGAVLTVDLPFFAEARGRFFTGIARAFPYYAPGEAAHAAGTGLTVGE